MRRVRRSRQRQQEAAEINVTAFMNLMVVLVPFLLVMAVFSRLAILELDLPSGDGGGETDPPTLALEVVVRSDRIDVQGRRQGLLKSLPSSEETYDLDGLADYLKLIKGKYPKKTDVTILLEPNISYEHVVAVMDTVRVARSVQAGEVVKGELFPDISIGDAPKAKGGAT